MNAPAVGHEELLLLPYTRALEALKDRDVVLTVVAPPYPALGRGNLHVVRVTADGDVTRVDVTYDDYERLP